MKKEYSTEPEAAKPTVDVVLMPFNSTLRRFPLGTAVSESDDFSPHSFDDLKTRGFIG